MEHLICEGCHQNIFNKEYIICKNCNQNYDLECANISRKRLSNIVDLEKAWHCPSCIVKKPRRNNENILACSNATLNAISQDPNVTLRKPLLANQRSSTELEHNDDSSVYELSTFDRSAFGDTITTLAGLPELERELAPSITIEQIEQLLDKKLEKIQNKLVSLIKTEIKSFIQEEIKNNIATMNTEITNKLDSVTTVQCKQSTDIQNLTEKINNLERERARLSKDIEYLQNNHHQCNNKPSHNNNNNAKKLVLYGLEEFNWETEDELYDRILYIFYDSMNICLEGHIDDLTRLGKRGPRRPIVIELVSKQMTRYILQNKHLLRGSGVMVDE
ncbi:hypothetical protein HF086_015465 [Spodoptera exigua]|uniref:PHD-type domain-containing protein n=1 Tax=Spodoptera exigua TaxID=7107 RepID=A0A922SF76_SPOEX|nr:hypothetical protein HF086_015465 [Spodoptera exigua]